MSTRILLSVLAVPILACVSSGAMSHAVGPTSASTPATSGPFVSLLFSRTEITAAIDCVPNDTGVARLDTEVAPYLSSLGMTASGTLMTGKIFDVARRCMHYNESMGTSWADAQQLSAQFGWRFVSHTATWPLNMSNMTPQQSYAETCGSAQAIDAHGLLGGHGLIAYPGDALDPVALQTQYGSRCFAWARTYDPAATTDWTAAVTAPYWQVTAAPRGGPCNITTAACYTIQALDSKRYVLPSVQIGHVNALTSGKWLTMQAFILVKGINPPGAAFQWDCRSPNARLHWTTDNERYCLRDWKMVVAAIAARQDIIVTDPLTVGVAFGRPASYTY